MKKRGGGPTGGVLGRRVDEEGVNSEEVEEVREGGLAVLVLELVSRGGSRESCPCWSAQTARSRLRSSREVGAP